MVDEEGATAQGDDEELFEELVSGPAQAVQQAPFRSPYASSSVTPDLRDRLLGAVFADSPLLAAARRAAASAARTELQRQAFSLAGPDLRRLALGFGLNRAEALQVAKRLTVSAPLIDKFARLDPENWRYEPLDREAMITVMEEGIPLVWVPPAEVIRDLCAEPDPAHRREILVARLDQVLHHGGQVLEAINRVDLASSKQHLRECLALLDEGRPAAAQALATCVWDTTLRALVRADSSLQNKHGGFTYKIIKAAMPQADMGVTVGKFRAYCLNTCLHAAWGEYFGPQVPPQYNRHATAHAVGPTQYTTANAAVAFMNALGLMRELEETQRPISPAD